MNGSGPVMKVLLVLEELELPYDYKQIDLVKGEQHRQDYKRLNPLSRVPTIRLSDSDFVLSESNAIMRYLVDKFQSYHLYPQNLEERAQVDRWVEYFSQHVNQYIGRLIWNRKFAPMFSMPVSHEAISEAEERLVRPLQDIEDHLVVHQSFHKSSHFTLADINALPWMGFWQDAQLPLSKYPAIQSWVDRCQKRHSWKQLNKTLET